MDPIKTLFLTNLFIFLAYNVWQVLSISMKNWFKYPFKLLIKKFNYKFQIFLFYFDWFKYLNLNFFHSHPFFLVFIILFLGLLFTFSLNIFTEMRYYKKKGEKTYTFVGYFSMYFLVIFSGLSFNFFFNILLNYIYF
jgi:hypothetical protein